MKLQVQQLHAERGVRALRPGRRLFPVIHISSVINIYIYIYTDMYTHKQSYMYVYIYIYIHMNRHILTPKVPLQVQQLHAEGGVCALRPGRQPSTSNPKP
jgi:hypothetical protein